MLIESFLPMSIKAFEDNISDRNPSYDWNDGAERRQMCGKCDEDSHGSCREAVSIMEKKNADGLSSSNIPTSILLSSASTISEKSMPNFVYKRKNQKVWADMRRAGDCNIAVSSNAPSVAEKELPISNALLLESEAVNGCIVPEEHGHGESSLMRKHKVIDVDSVNDSCSSKSNTELVSAPLIPEIDETGECSSSSVIIATEGSDDVPPGERDICISIFRSEGLLQRPQSSPVNASVDGINISSGCSSSRSCKTCGRSAKATKMLICDHCDEAFHLFCCNPRVKKVEEDDWYCGSCSKKKHLLLRQRSTIRSTRINCEVSRSKNDGSSPISFMLEDTENYITSVRVGKGFQAEVPDWVGPVNTDADMIDEAKQVDPSDFCSFSERNSVRVSQISTIGNWLQCRQVVDDARDGTGGTVCGKWRRAPLFEVQTDNWECFCSIFWDPSQADCAVPQELETDQVLKQLKYIEMLRPQLAAKRRKLV